jgi:hypothetical protein
MPNVRGREGARHRWTTRQTTTTTMTKTTLINDTSNNQTVRRRREKKGGESKGRLTMDERWRKDEAIAIIS